MGLFADLEEYLDGPLNTLRAIFAAGPVVKDALAGGPAAFKAFMEKAPDAAAHLQALADAIKKSTGDDKPADENEIAVVAAHVVGVDPPGWTSAETKAWINRASEGAMQH